MSHGHAIKTTTYKLQVQRPFVEFVTISLRVGSSANMRRSGNVAAQLDLPFSMWFSHLVSEFRTRFQVKYPTQLAGPMDGPGPPEIKLGHLKDVKGRNCTDGEELRRVPKSSVCTDSASYQLKNNALFSSSSSNLILFFFIFWLFWPPTVS